MEKVLHTTETITHVQKNVSELVEVVEGSARFFASGSQRIEVVCQFSKKISGKKSVLPDNRGKNYQAVCQVDLQDFMP